MTNLEESAREIVKVIEKRLPDDVSCGRVTLEREHEGVTVRNHLSFLITPLVPNKYKDGEQLSLEDDFPEHLEPLITSLVQVSEQEYPRTILRGVEITQEPGGALLLDFKLSVRFEPEPPGPLVPEAFPRVLLTEEE